MVNGEEFERRRNGSDGITREKRHVKEHIAVKCFAVFPDGRTRSTNVPSRRSHAFLGLSASRPPRLARSVLYTATTFYVYAPPGSTATRTYAHRHRPGPVLEDVTRVLAHARERVPMIKSLRRYKALKRTRLDSSVRALVRPPIRTRHEWHSWLSTPRPGWYDEITDFSD